MSMKTKVLLVLLVSLLLVGCAKSSNETKVYVISYINADGSQYWYDSEGKTYCVSSNIIEQIDGDGLIQQPALRYTPTSSAYHLSKNFAGNYTCKPEDAFGYCTYMVSKGYKLIQESATPYMCTITLDGDYHYKLYIEPNITRIYCLNADGIPVEPGYLGDDNE